MNFSTTTKSIVRGLLCYIAGIVLIWPIQAHGSPKTPSDSLIQKKEYQTVKIQGVAPVIDGILSDEAWNAVEWNGDFLDFQPEEGKVPAQKTTFKILYDDKNLYVAIKCYDSNPEKIVKRLGRRDNTDGDWAGIMIDSYFDHLTAFEFDVNAVGVIGDAYIANDFENEDYSWDPIWYVKTSIDREGWNAEMRIPLSQLRFPEKPELVWGLEVLRNDFRSGELSLWQLVHKSSPGLVHLFGELHGLEGLKPQKQLEIMPYVLGKIQNSEKEAGNPYATGSRKIINGGLDAKIGLTSNFTLDLSINPDFGQVEADPSIVNLTGFQNYFSERRPFFVESNNILDYQVSQSIAWGSFNSDDLFYSRRIGHSPQGYPDLADNEFTRVPDNTTILGAMKLTGKTQKGLSVGVLESVTQKELAKISDGTNESSEVVEPLTNYFESRIIQDYDKGNTQIGGIFTSVNRSIDNPEVDFLHHSAYTGGLDFIHNWNKKTWYLSGNVILSQVNGSPESITATQTSQEHLFQRPGSGRIKVDSSLTSMSGTGATLKFGKGGNGKIQFQLGGSYKSPSLELNDMGYLYKANALYQFAWASYHVYDPWWILNRFQCNINQWTNWDFAGNNLYRAANYNMHMQFKNYINIGGGITGIFYKLDNDLLRGGPAFRVPGGTESFGYISSDYRKKFQMELDYNGAAGNNNSMRAISFQLWMRYQPFKNFSFSLSPGYNVNENALQFVTETASNNSPVYLMGNINQVTANITARLNYSITPNLSLQYYGQPFISKGLYKAFKRVTNTGAAHYEERFHPYAGSEISFDKINNTYSVDENTDGVSEFTFDNPDFDFVQFNSNMVLRWEYKPGSTLFVVWSQARTGSQLLEEPTFGNLTNNLFEVYPNDVFLIKFSYRFIR